MFKSNCLAFAYFWSKYDNSFFDWCKTVNICNENIPSANMKRKWYFLTENLKGWTVKPGIFHEDKTYQS